MKIAPVSPLLLSALGTALAPSATAQSFEFADFSSIAGLTLNEDADQSGALLHLTDGGGSDVGSVFFDTALPVAEGFTTEFTFRMSGGAEGFAFVIHGSPDGDAAIGGNLWGLGYGFGNSGGAISNCLAIEFDGQQQTFLNDTSGNEISVHTQGTLANAENEGASIARISPGGNFADNQLHTVRITYVPDQIEIFVDDLTAPILTAQFTFEAGGTQLTGGNTGGLDLPGIDGWVGLTAANPITTGQHVELHAWSWQSFFGPDDCYVGNALNGSTGPHDLLTINNSNGAFLRTVRLLTADPFSIEIAPPPGEASAPFVLFATIGLADALTISPTPYGTACFPLVNGIDIGGFLAPFQVQIPAGIPLTFPLTFQAVMATDSLNPSQLELSNAVGLDFTQGLPPLINSVSPNSAAPGNLITIAGSAFSPFATIDIDGTPVAPLFAAESQITFLMPAGAACDSTLTVRNPDGAADSRPFNPTPTITNEVSSSGPASGGGVYVVIGQGFAPGMTATIGGTNANVSSSSATAVVINPPAGTPGPAPVVLTTPGGCTVTSTYTYF